MEQIQYPIKVYSYVIKGFNIDGFNIFERIFEQPPLDGTIDEICDGRFIRKTPADVEKFKSDTMFNYKSYWVNFDEFKLFMCEQIKCFKLKMDIEYANKIENMNECMVKLEEITPKNF
jgi:hypothetical protein